MEWGFMTLISVGIGLTAKFLAKLSKSIDNLNQSVATMIEKNVWHEKELEIHSKRLENLESQNLKRGHK